jgi:hypothetical protein
MAYDPRDAYRNQAGSPTSNVAHQPGYSGPMNAAEYTASGVPFSEQVTAPSGAIGAETTAAVNFPFITSELYVKNDGLGEVAFGWTNFGTLNSTNRHVLKPAEAISMRIRCKTLYVTSVSGSASDVSVTAALTIIPAKSFPVLTGSLADATTGLPVYVTGTLEMRWGYNGVG